MQMHKQKTQHMNMGMAAHTAEAMIVHVYTNDQMQCHMPSTSVMCYFGILHMCYFRKLQHAHHCKPDPRCLSARRLAVIIW